MLKEILYNTCTSHREAAAEIGCHRVQLTMFLNGKIRLDTRGYEDAHRTDWSFTPNKLMNAISLSELTQRQAAVWIGVDAPYLSRVLNGRIRPSKQIYLRIKDFCLNRGIQ